MRAAPTADIKRTTSTRTLRRAVTPAERIRLGILILSATVTTALFVFYLAQAVSWLRSPFLGVMLTHTHTVNNGRSTDSDNWPGIRAGLLPGDHILTVNNVDVRDAELLDALIGDGYRTIIFERSALDGTVYEPPIEERHANYLTNCEVPYSGQDVAQCRTTFQAEPFPFSDLLAFAISPFLTGTVVLVIGLGLMILRPFNVEAFAPILGCFFLAIFMFGIFDGSTTHQLGPVWLAATTLLGGMLVTLGMTFPSPLPILHRLPWLRYSALAGSAVLFVIIAAQYYSAVPGQANGSAASATITLIMGNTILTVLLFYYQRPRAVTAIQRDQANTLFIGALLSMIPAALWLVSLVLRLVTNSQALAYSVEATMPFFLPPAVSVAYAVLQLRHGDTDRMLSTTFTYTLMLIALVIGYFLLVQGASLLLIPNVIQSNDPLIITLTIFLMSMLFLPVRTWLQRRIENIFLRRRRSYQDLLEGLSLELTTLTDNDVILSRFQNALAQSVNPSAAIVFLYDVRTGYYLAHGNPAVTDIVFNAESGIIDLLRNSNTTFYLEPGRPWPNELKAEHPRLKVLRTLLLAGMSGKDRLNGFISIAAPKSHRVYEYEDLRFINNLVSQVAAAIDRTQDRTNMEQRVRQLDVLSRVGQAVNFTIQMDDLLELISAQTSQIIEAPNFYIVLYEPLVSQLYFGFFVEEDDRDRQKEGRRWIKGRDLFSEVIDTNQPRQVEDYGLAMRRGGLQFNGESPDIKAWLGVPLIAGSRTLGVVAVGETDPTKTFTRDQVRILSDISSLAASAIDRARLFAETDTRAKQLKVLNDITRQMVAAEADIEMLLELITSAAVEILNGQAGSLLLTADDSSGALEFKTAIGGTGQDLIGTRLPAGYGLVGKVATTGEPVIVNDTSRDERFDGDVSTFQTKSVLAVPLVGKDGVVGVLEVLNKTDGTPFVDEDLKLLSTFAGQAAIALENARLFQMTDLQLSRRVQELETLEQIDKELNRTLDLEKVAQITVRWAVANSGAAAGMLGVLTQNNDYLRIVATYGYRRESLDEHMTEDGLWPIDRGIIKRVLRTRRSDLAPDVVIDPDYVELLPRSLSQITVPMLSGNDVIAVLVLETNREPRFNLLDLDFVQRLAEHSAIAIANAQYYLELTRANATKSEFVAFAAHELKNPLASVKGYADLLQSGMTGPITDQQRDFLSTIRSNASRMQTIIDDLRDIAKIDAQLLNISPAPTRLYTIVMETLRGLQHQIAEKKQTVINNVSEDLPLVLADENRLVQVMTNFISNAHKYSPPQATIIIDAKRKEIFRTKSGQDIGPLLLVSIRDTGIGMSQEDLQKIFKVRYFRSDNDQARQQPGTGLGMMITQNLIEQHNGQVWVESELGKGTTFYFTLPLAAEVLGPNEDTNEDTQNPSAKETEPASD